MRAALLLAVAGVLPAAVPQQCHAQVPSLDELSGEWVPATLLRDTPSISNWRGSVGTNVDLVDTSSFIAPPFAGGPSMLRMQVDGKEVVLDATKWSAYEATRQSQPLAVDAHTITVTSQLRMGWNDSALMWKVNLTNKVLEGVPPDAISYDDIIHTLEFSVQAIARKFDSMGWLLTDPPRSPRQYQTRLVFPTDETGASRRAMVLHEDTLSDAVSGFAFVDQQPSEWAWVKDPQHRNRSAAVGLVNFFVAPGETASLRLVAAMGSAKEEGGLDGMARRLEGYAANFDKHWDEAKAGWERLWAEAFTPPSSSDSGPPRRFSGHLPVLTTADTAVRRVYYMGALSLLAMGRTSLTAFDDDEEEEGGGGQTSYLTGFGNTCWTRGDLRPEAVECLKPVSTRDTAMAPVYIGATAQFYWDTSLRALLTSLLDPAALRRYILTFMSLGDGHFEASFGLDALNGAPIGYEYAFNAHSIFTIVGTYLRATNDTGLLAEVVGDGVTVNERLEAVAMDWVRRRIPVPSSPDDGDAPSFSLWPFSSSKDKSKGRAKPAADGEEEEATEDPAFYHLSDYGGDINTFLECVPTYLHATPALQAGNAEMMAWMARLRAAEGNSTGARHFARLAQGIARDTVEHLYVKGGEGTFGCLYPTEPDYQLVPVRHVIDFIYVSRGLAVVGPEALPTHLSGQMSFYFHDELETPTWIRALSPYDRLNLKVPRPRAILRPDHGITGAFDAWAALAVEALAINDGTWDGALTVLRHQAAATREGPFGQAHEINDMDYSVFKTKRGFTRFTADNGGSFSEVILRGVFGYDPPFLAPQDPSLAFQGLERALRKEARTHPRGNLAATLENLRTPWGLATLDVGPTGVTIVDLVPLVTKEEEREQWRRGKQHQHQHQHQHVRRR